MIRDYSRLDCYNMQLHELQPAQFFDLTQSSPGSHYEMTTLNGGGLGGGLGGGACEVATLGSTHVPSGSHPLHNILHPHPHHDPKKRKNSHFSDGFDGMTNGDTPMQGPAPVHMLTPGSATRKRKTSSFGTVSAYDDDGDDSRSTRTLPDKKQNHSEIEKRRRDKMNTYIAELSSMVPMCGAMARKLDKLTVLRMAVQHLRTIRGALTACPLTARPRPAFLSEKELNALILHAAHDSFLIVVGCDRGRLLYVSASVQKMLNYGQAELLGQSMFDILHPKDVAKVKEQLSSSDLSPRERLIDAKTMLPVKADVMAGASRLCPGARRSFFCRIKCKTSSDADDAADAAHAAHAAHAIPGAHAAHAAHAAHGAHVVKEDPEPAAKLRKKQTYEKKYCVVQCTGYLKSWAPAEVADGSTSPEGGDEVDACNLSCLVAVGRALPDLAPTPYGNPTPVIRKLQYVSRHAIDGKFVFVDQRVTQALGFLPQELLGTSLYEYVSGPQLGVVARTHKAALLTRDALQTPPYPFRRKDGSHTLIQTNFKPFRNPWTRDVECLIANNTIVTAVQTPAANNDSQTAYDIFKQKSDLEVQRLIDSQVESHKIGSAIAEEVMRRSSTDFSPDLPTDLLQDVGFGHQSSLVENILGGEMGPYQVRNNVSLSSAGGDTSPFPSEGEGIIATESPDPESPPLPSLGLDGNGEAAMAVIMSLLEADAGLGGPVNFSGLPWPLP